MGSSQPDNIQYIDVKKPLITQSMIIEYERLKTNMAILQRRLDISKSALLFALKNPDHVVEDGELEIILKENKSRRPKWKEHFISETSEARAAEIIDCTPYSFSYEPEVRVKGTL